MNHFCLVIEPEDLDAIAARFPSSQRADGLFGAQGFASSVYVKDPDGNTVELRYYEE
jgi:catechol-2,3-dioxygenase